MKYHPDRNKKDTTKKFIDIKEAYETLSKYDPNPSPQIYSDDLIIFDNGGYHTTGTTGTFTFNT